MLSTQKILLGFALFLFVSTGCATNKMDHLLQRVETMQVAQHYFGEPAAQQNMKDGSIRYEWRVNRTTQIAGQYKERTQIIGTDRDGFPRRVTRTYFDPAHMEHQASKLTIFATPEGKVLRSSWQGNKPEALFRVPVL